MPFLIPGSSLLRKFFLKDGDGNSPGQCQSGSMENNLKTGNVKFCKKIPVPGNRRNDNGAAGKEVMKMLIMLCRGKSPPRFNQKAGIGFEMGKAVEAFCFPLPPLRGQMFCI